MCHCALQTETREIVLGGDGRPDSPGHSVKYGSYTVTELEASAVVGIQLVQSNECGDSHHMEKEGLLHSVDFLQHELLQINTVITNGHRQTEQ